MGIYPSREMVEQARARNAPALQGGHVDLRHGSVESLPFDDNCFDKALAINSMQVWPDAVAGLREMRRVMKPGGEIALGFTPYSGQPNKRTDGNTHRRWLHKDACGGDEQRVLRAGDKTVRNRRPPALT